MNIEAIETSIEMRGESKLDVYAAIFEGCKFVIEMSLENGSVVFTRAIPPDPFLLSDMTDSQKRDLVQEFALEEYEKYCTVRDRLKECKAVLAEYDGWERESVVGKHSIETPSREFSKTLYREMERTNEELRLAAYRKAVESGGLPRIAPYMMRRYIKLSES